jgi:Xaa-Pro aminopeptidase
MRHAPISPDLFKLNRYRLRALLPPNSLVVLNANDVLPTNGDGSLRLVPNSDLFYLTGVEQEESILLIFPDADDEKHRELLFLREAKPELETWEGHKLTKEEASELTGIKRIHWLAEFPRLFHRLMCQAEHVFLNSNEHPRAVVEVETREARFVADVLRRYPLHEYHRLGLLMHRLRVLKSPEELRLIQEACRITQAGFERVARFVKPGVNEAEIEAEFAHEFIRNRGQFAYSPIIASGKNSCVLHYISNDKPCRAGDLLLLDVAASYANYNADLTRTLPVSGNFNRRQKEVYNAVLRAYRAQVDGLVPGKKWKDWQKEAEQNIETELIALGLLKPAKIKKQNPDWPALKEFFMHGIGHPLGLDVHDYGFMTEPFVAGTVMTVEPGIYIPKEGIGVRLETDVLIGQDGNTDLLSEIPVEPGAVEDLMNQR